MICSVIGFLVGLALIASGGVCAFAAASSTRQQLLGLLLIAVPVILAGVGICFGCGHALWETAVPPPEPPPRPPHLDPDDEWRE